MNDITKLPKWAQEKIKHLEIELSEAQSQNERLTLENSKTGSGHITFTVGMADEVVLSDFATINFDLSDDCSGGLNVIRVALRQTRDGAYIDVNCDKSLVAQPIASNSLRIRTSEFWG